MEKNILLTGETGFIGSQLAEKFLKDGRKLIFLKRSYSNLWRVEDFIDNCDNLEIVDVDKVDIKDVFESFDIEGILHLATYYSKFHSSNEVNDMMYSNITFPTLLLENAVKNNVKYFINTGSYAEYSTDKIPISENSEILPFNLYASTKVAFEEILKFYNKEYGLKTASLKLFTPYGLKDDEDKIIPYLIIKALKKEKIIIQSTSKKLDVLYVDDIINAYEKTIENIPKFKKNENINIASGISHSIKEIYDIVNSILGDTDVKFLESDVSEVRADISKAKVLINWKPKISLEEGLNLTIEYYKKLYG
ncbi:MAG: NAD-dependent epimerase/dehydratase family protein [Methanobrevibacter sp.]|jgi:nucleoside-diphosphate-sugar epimerase|nr:NAD-dependent epimerase/dehydratase family protein [Candidatus Methanovirga basalitermitum]